jgi:hypothetical protein
MSDPRDLGQLVGTMSACLSEAMSRAISLCNKLDGDKNKQSFLKQFRVGLIASGRDTAYVDKTMTTMNQCCLKGMVFMYMDPKLNKDSQVRGSKRRYDANGADDVSDKGEDADDEDDGEPSADLAVGTNPKPKPVSKRKRKRGKSSAASSKKSTIVIAVHSEPCENPSRPPLCNPVSPARNSSDSLINAKYYRSACMNLSMLERLFEVSEAGIIAWNNGSNYYVELLLHIGSKHDTVLCSNHRVPCGSVCQEFKEAIPEWTKFENSKCWQVEKTTKVENFNSSMGSAQRWAISAPEVKGAIGLVFWCIVAYFPELCFTNISHHDSRVSQEFKNNRAMAMLPRKFSHELFSLLEAGGYINQDGHLTHPQEFWETSAVCLSSNDSALDVTSVQRSYSEQRFKVFSDQDSDCFHFDDPPAFWGLHPHQSWVKIAPDMWGEIGVPR